jgi:hypothetical protein
MADRRKEQRVRASLLVEVSGLDAHGEVFHESALATNLSRSGALLTKVSAEPRCGDLIAVDHAGRQAVFRVVWVMDSGTEDRVQVAIHKLGGQSCPWEEILPDEAEVAGVHAGHR